MIQIEQSLVRVRPARNQVDGHAAQRAGKVQFREMTEQNGPVMFSEISKHRLQKQGKLHPLAVELGEPAFLRGERPSQQSFLPVGVPSAREPGDGLRDVKLRDFVALRLEQLEEPREALREMILAEQPNLFPSRVAVGIGEILQQVILDFPFHSLFALERFLEQNQDPQQIEAILFEPLVFQQRTYHATDRFIRRRLAPEMARNQRAQANLWVRLQRG